MGARSFTPRNNRNFAGRNSQIRQFSQNGSRITLGEVQNISSDRLTLKTREGSNQIVLINNDTSFKKLSDATQADFQNGINVMITGKANPDGSITATNIQTAPENTMQPPVDQQARGPQRN